MNGSVKTQGAFCASNPIGGMENTMDDNNTLKTQCQDNVLPLPLYSTNAGDPAFRAPQDGDYGLVHGYDEFSKTNDAGNLIARWICASYDTEYDGWVSEHNTDCYDVSRYALVESGAANGEGGIQ